VSEESVSRESVSPSSIIPGLVPAWYWLYDKKRVRAILSVLATSVSFSCLNETSERARSS
jgi:hypothetical protein